MMVVLYLVGGFVLALGHIANALPTVERNKFEIQEIADIENTPLVGRSLDLTDQNFTDVFEYIMAANKRFSESVVARKAGVTMYQGDIISNEDTDVVESSNTEVSGSRQKRAIIRDEKRRWKKSGSRITIPYVITSSNTHAKSKIEGAMREWETKISPCLRFKTRSKERDYLSFFAGGGCYSMVGRQGGKQVVSIGRGCEHHGVIVHEIGHALGFWHEQSRPDRDEYVTINWSNIPEGVKSNFVKYSKSKVRNYWNSYDYYSIMHYGPKAFAKNQKYSTIIPKRSGVTIGQRRGLSSGDVKQARAMYCPSSPRPTSRPRPKPTRPPTACYKDKHSSCAGWVKEGYCTNGEYKKWMAENCCRSCRSPRCVDKESIANCRNWRDQGFCTDRKYGPYMKNNCCKSCSRPPCTDKNQNCKQWAANGYCRSNDYGDYMSKNCCASCR